MSYQLLASTADNAGIQWASGAALIGIVALIVAWLVLFVAALVSILRSPNYQPGGKALWCLASFAFPLLGPILWFAVGKKSTM